MASQTRKSPRRTSGTKTVTPSPLKRPHALDLDGAGGGSPRKLSNVKELHAVAPSPSKNGSPRKKKQLEEDEEEDEGTLLGLVRAWLKAKLSGGVGRTMAVTMAFKKKQLTETENDVCGRLVNRDLALVEFLGRKDGTLESLVKVFKAVVGKDDLDLMLLSEKALLDKNEGEIASFHSERIKTLINELIEGLPAQTLKQLEIGEDFERLLSIVRNESAELELEDAPIRQKKAKGTP